MDEKEKVVIDPSKISNEIKGKYTLTNNSFKMVAKDNPKDLVEAIIGDDKQLDFMPQVKIQRWDNEVNFSVRLVDDELTKPTITTVKDKIVWTNVEKDIKFYDISPNEEHPEGGYEFEVILKEKPKSNVVSFTLNTKGLDFFYQPPLTQKEIDEGAVRPENVVGSYAVYHKTKGGMNNSAGMEYKVGKFGHIYRPKIIDANGSEIWGELNVNEQNGLLTVTVDQTWLDNAIYPIIVDPTFGYAIAGASNTSGANYYLGSLFTSPADIGTIIGLSMYKVSSFEANLKGVITNSSKQILTNGVGNATSPTNDSNWNYLPYTTFPTIAESTDYYLGLVMENTGAPLAMDTTGGTSNTDTSNSYTTPTDPTDGTGGTRLYSVFVDYVPSTTTIFDYYGMGNSSNKMSVGGGRTYSKIGQTFNAGSSGNLVGCEIPLYKSGSPTGSAYAVLYAHTGTYGTDGTPTGGALATSDAFDVSALTDDDPRLFYFTFSTPYSLTSGTKYCLSLEYAGGSSTNYIGTTYDGTSPSHGGNIIFYTVSTSTWAASASYDAIFYAFGTAGGGAVVQDMLGGIIPFAR